MAVVVVIPPVNISSEDSREWGWSQRELPGPVVCVEICYPISGFMGRTGEYKIHISIRIVIGKLHTRAKHPREVHIHQAELSPQKS